MNILKIKVDTRIGVAYLELNREKIEGIENTFFLNKWIIDIGGIQEIEVDFGGNIPYKTFVLEYKNCVYTLRKYSSPKIILSSRNFEDFEEGLQDIIIKTKIN